MTCQNLQNKLLNITVLFIWYLLQIVGEFKENVTRKTWRALFHFGYCLKKMVSHTVKSIIYYCIMQIEDLSDLDIFLKIVKIYNLLLLLNQLLICFSSFFKCRWLKNFQYPTVYIYKNLFANHHATHIVWSLGLKYT